MRKTKGRCALTCGSISFKTGKNTLFLYDFLLRNTNKHIPRTGNLLTDLNITLMY